MPSSSAHSEFFGPMLIVRDFASSLEFYRTTLRLEGGGAPPYAEFASPHGKLVLLDHAFWKSVGGGALPTPGAWKREGVVLAIKVKDVDAEFQRLGRAGVAIASPPADRPMMGLRNFQVYDPDGNAVEVYGELKRPASKPPKGRKASGA